MRNDIWILYTTSVINTLRCCDHLCCDMCATVAAFHKQRTVVGQRFNLRLSPFSKFSDKPIRRIFLAQQQAGKCGRVDVVQLIDIDLGQATGAHSKLRVCANALGRDQQGCARHKGIDGTICAGSSEEKRKSESHRRFDVVVLNEVLRD